MDYLSSWQIKHLQGKNMDKKERIKNLVAFLYIIFSEINTEVEIINKSPAYILEKFERYVLSDKPEYDWGMHPILKEYFDEYCKEWNL